MRIENKHVFTAGAQAPKGIKAPKLSSAFKKGAPINMSSTPLKERVSVPQKVTKRGENLSKQVGQILKGIPTPFIKR